MSNPLAKTKGSLVLMVSGLVATGSIILLYTKGISPIFKKKRRQEAEDFANVIFEKENTHKNGEMR